MKIALLKPSSVENRTYIRINASETPRDEMLNCYFKRRQTSFTNKQTSALDASDKSTTIILKNGRLPREADIVKMKRSIEDTCG